MPRSWIGNRGADRLVEAGVIVDPNWRQHCRGWLNVQRSGCGCGGVGSNTALRGHQAWEATPVATYSATIQTGSCAEVCLSVPGVGYNQPIVASLPHLVGDPIHIPGSELRPPVTIKTTVVPRLADLLATPHVIAIHVFPGRLDACIACGAIRGVPDDDEALFCDLAAVGGSETTGLAWLQDTAAGTMVTLSVGSGLRGSAARQAIQSAPMTLPPRGLALYGGMTVRRSTRRGGEARSSSPLSWAW